MGEACLDYLRPSTGDSPVPPDGLDSSTRQRVVDIRGLGLLVARCRVAQNPAPMLAFGPRSYPKRAKLMILSLGFDGFRGFPCRRQYDRSRPFQRLDLAPLTLLIGRNNAGKTSVAALLRQVLGGMANATGEPLPLVVGGVPVADTFQDLLPRRDLSGFLEVSVSLDGEGGPHELETILYLRGLLDDDPRPWAHSIRWDEEDIAPPEGPLNGGLIPGCPGAEALRQEAARLLRASAWLGPLRDSVPTSPTGRRPERGAVPLGPRGEGVTDLLAAEPKVFQAVSGWLREHAGLSLSWERNLDLWRLQASGGIPLAQLGTGVHQLLPVLTLAQWRGLTPEAGPYLDVVQQPEIHLHDALHPALGDLCLDVAKLRRGVTVVETHAEGLLLRVRRRIAEGQVPPDLVALYFVDDRPDGSELRRIRILETGEVGDWPEGVFLESYEEVKALRRAQRRRAG